jgi:phospholipid transport system substrate-binding protein
VQGLLLVCLLFLAVGPVASGQGPVEMLRATTDQVLEAVRADPTVLDSPARVRRLANELVLPHVDFVTLSRWVLGKHWRTATPEQRDAFVEAFREMLVASYLRSMTEYRDNDVVFEPLRKPAEGGRVSVHAVITQPNGPLVKVIFRLHQPKQAWLIYDMVVDGVSLVTTHRSSIAQEIRRGGMDGLIARLQARIAEEPVETADAEAGAKPGPSAE